MEDTGRQIVEALASRPDDERPWQALRRAFDVVVQMNDAAPEQALRFLRMLQGTPSPRARHVEKQLGRQEMLAPEIARRLGVDSGRPEDTRPSAPAAAASACVDVAAIAWPTTEGTVPLAVLLDHAMDALGE
ncbi:TetR family transcriptional regulator [Streptomyces sp. Li-HN-5-11]|uniref:acyl-CoA-like ligand-binding transcription factor n=1 Tax=Streptomyces sp. Li-HN-5-11 TaxID=3075432 RepID=UPI0028ABD871|nr:TetR family transcriptional regulator [Streptomyces sp. Li-HN-5-11]WNM31955.1 TetR family transcriptional regulator [Streptomyces sp. Li-HN-5-11]